MTQTLIPARARSTSASRNSRPTVSFPIQYISSSTSRSAPAMAWSIVGRAWPPSRSRRTRSSPTGNQGAAESEASDHDQQRVVAQIRCRERSHGVEGWRGELGPREPKVDHSLTRLKGGGQAVARDDGGCAIPVIRRGSLEAELLDHGAGTRDASVDGAVRRLKPNREARGERRSHDRGAPYGISSR